MFDKILIANRGEIACRVVETARKLGVLSVAVYSDADRLARHVTMADQAVHIGSSAPAESYLRGDVIIQAALDTGAQAIHPGYGFLSENPDFVRAVDAAGLTFIGPSADAIGAMGMKDSAKALMEKSGVPVVPGYHGVDQDPDFLKSQAAKIGYPVLIKAIAGGGGKGMRIVNSAKDFSTALNSARSEAKTAFGEDAVLIEKFVTNPRHIEVQVFGDGKNVVHLFERDCSLQRRHQKVVEEAPAPGMTPEMRAAMGDAAVLAAKAIKYKGAGTVEFIVDGSKGLHPERFWFMEMNTRLQVEHPVTEAVSGVDLVEWQMRVAAGEALPKQQDELHLNGHAVEARLYAEDAENGFLPVSGTIGHLKFAPNVRSDTGVRAGEEISPFYDPMIAKIISHGATRDIALGKLSAALGATEIVGLTTNLEFLGKLVRYGDFAAGQVDTGLIDRSVSELCVADEPGLEAIAMAAITASGIDNSISWHSGFSLWQPLEQTVTIWWRSQKFCVVMIADGSTGLTIKIEKQQITARREGSSWIVFGEQPKMHALKSGPLVSVFGKTTWHFDIPDPLAVVEADQAKGNIIAAPMPGVITDVLIEPGQMVATGEALIVLEAMKMEHILTAPRSGQIQDIGAIVGEQVTIGAILIILADDQDGQDDG